jgi:hypothetical protein
MCMKTNRTATICQPKMTTFMHDLAECSDISYQPPRILRESGPFSSRIEHRRTRSWFQSGESQEPGFTGCGNITGAGALRLPTVGGGTGQPRVTTPRRQCAGPS